MLVRAYGKQQNPENWGVGWGGAGVRERERESKRELVQLQSGVLIRCPTLKRQEHRGPDVFFTLLWGAVLRKVTKDN